MYNSEFPTARKNNLVIQDIAEEILVYDLTSNKAHCLNETAAFVWRVCDGKNSISEIKRHLELSSGEEVKEDLIRLAIEQLKERDLIEENIETGFSRQNRREVIKKIGLASVIALPLITSLTAPTSVLAQASCACGAPADCSGTGCPSTVNCNPMGQCEP